jgi:hypothetical protein
MAKKPTAKERAAKHSNDIGSELAKRVGTNAKTRALALGTNLSELAREHEIPRATVYGWLAGGMRLSSLATLASMLQLPPYALLLPNFEPSSDYE